MNRKNPHLVAMTLCCALSVTMAAAAAERKQSYDIPKGAATTTLLQFARASGQEILFMTDKVRGEKTNAIAGEYTAPEALDRLLAGTGLSAARDPASGAFFISRKPRATSNGTLQSLSPIKPSTEEPKKT